MSRAGEKKSKIERLIKEADELAEESRKCRKELKRVFEL